VVPLLKSFKIKTYQPQRSSSKQWRHIPRTYRFKLVDLMHCVSQSIVKVCIEKGILFDILLNLIYLDTCSLTIKPFFLPYSQNILGALSARDDSFKEHIVNSGGITAIAEAMTRYPASRQMQARGFVVMWSCAAGSGVPKSLKVRVGQCGIEPVVNGLSNHITSEKACEDALGCIKCLSTVPQNKELIDDRAVDLIYACMLLHSENSTVAKAALAALCNVSVNVDTNQVTEITKEDLDAIVLVMRAHQDVKVVQESAIILLRNFTFFSSNVELMAETPFLVNLVRSAMAKHNDLFLGRAEEILRCLPEPGQ